MTGEILPITEPYLQFTMGKEVLHFDPRVGLIQLHPLDYNSGRRDFGNIQLAIIAKASDLLRILNLLNDLNNTFEPEGKTSKVAYMGFEQIYKAKLIIPSKDDKRVITLTNAEISAALESEKPFDRAVSVYSAKIQHLKDGTDFDVLILHIPDDYASIFKSNGRDLRDHIKRKCIEKQVKSQIITRRALRPYNKWDNVWNLSVGIYVKAGGVPWKLSRTYPSALFVGISFGIKQDSSEDRTLIGVAEIFDEYGDNVSIKVIECQEEGVDYQFDIVEKGYHLSKNKMNQLLGLAIEGYNSCKGLGGRPPKHIIIHKTSSFIEQEVDGILEMLKSIGDIRCDAVHIKTKTLNRLIPQQTYPPKRGTFWKINKNRGVLYTTGVVETFGTYPGAATPSPLEINREIGDSPIQQIAEQILALTKMDWNTTDFMNKEPVSIAYSRKVVNVLKAGLVASEEIKDFRYYI